MPLTDVTIKYLEMSSPAELRAKRSALAGLTVSRVPRPTPEINKFYYATVGAKYFWIDRLSWPVEKWQEYLGQPGIDTYVMEVDGKPAGYFELQHHQNGDVEIKYFGLIDGFIGQGLGAHMLTVATEAAWGDGATRVILDTCSLDHPKAFGHYVARGFKQYDVKVVRKEIPSELR